MINNQVNSQQNKQQIQRRHKSKANAQANAFTCFLVYFLVKAIIIMMLYKYDNILKHQKILIIPFIIILITNSYLMLTTGKNPGYEQPLTEQSQNLNNQKIYNFCQICNCKQKNRTKHCYQCGKCVRKFDHHCPWIGSCVGENNHCRFWVHLNTHLTQAIFTLWILCKSMGYYEYATKDGSFSAEYGAYAIFAIFMVFYILFAGSLFCFHTYLIISNLTTRQIMSPKKCKYLQGQKTNPFNYGIFKNIIMSINPIINGSQWLVQPYQEQQKQKKSSFLAKIWKNQYYQCC